ncbi:hypothetical protein [Shouchella shacheensis]|uniref:hypothetical protein n=1 Tax=Shouchella shacheensis TaxID=1649580 RepID=UPI000B00ACE4|nr:hypothetical protein [Shouchella shacheensis]
MKKPVFAGFFSVFFSAFLPGLSSWCPLARGFFTPPELVARDWRASAFRIV